VGMNPIQCPPPTDLCHVVGTCNPSTGICSNPEKRLDCSGGNHCIAQSLCQIDDGSCIPVPNTGATCTLSGFCQSDGQCHPALQTK